MKKLPFLLPIALLFFAAGVASAQQVTFEVSATVNYVDDMYNKLQGNVFVGQQISGTYTFESSVPDGDSSYDSAYYDLTNTGAQGFDLLAGGLSFKSDPTQSGYMHTIHIRNSLPDNMHFGTWGSVPLPDGTLVWDINLDFIDDTGSAFNDTLLSDVPPDLNKFNIKDLHISGDSFWFGAKIDSIQPAGGYKDPNLVVYSMDATVSWVNDTAGDFAGALSVGQNLNGTYTFNITTPDSNPDPANGHFTHLPGNGAFGFDFASGGYNFKSDPTQVPMEVDLYNSQYNDNYLAFTNMMNVALPNGATITDISFYIYDASAQLISSDQLSTSAPVLGSNGWAEIYIGGIASNGIDWFSINATINSINVINPPDPNLMVVSPASGMFDRRQMFDSALIFAPNLAPVESTSLVAIINGVYLPMSNCFQGYPNPQGRQTFICPGFAFQLGSGKNTVSFKAQLQDGTSFFRTETWEIIGN